ncbi:hypothetical protein BDR07DRAFT_1414902 [Suillus spraguei]|nr:hypothetical protein BDR07DRAFT_1414902 [Suillus spraguei]
MILSEKELLADIKAEDIEFGVHERELVLDVDIDFAEDNDDEGGVNTKLGIDVEECGGNFFDIRQAQATPLLVPIHVVPFCS